MQCGGTLDFSIYDDIVVVHAGLGGESSNQLNDVPSAFINQADLDTYVEGPIPVNGGSTFINKGILLPESGGTDGRSGLTASSHDSTRISWDCPVLIILKTVCRLLVIGV